MEDLKDKLKDVSGLDLKTLRTVALTLHLAYFTPGGIVAADVNDLVAVGVKRRPAKLIHSHFNKPAGNRQ